MQAAHIIFESIKNNLEIDTDFELTMSGLIDHINAKKVHSFYISKIPTLLRLYLAVKRGEIASDSIKFFDFTIEVIEILDLFHSLPWFDVFTSCGKEFLFFYLDSEPTE